MSDNHVCEMCGADVSGNELRQGLAVRIGGNVVCSHCVDTLPTDAQIRINQMRALRGMDAKIYRFRWPAHPQLECYTFNTAAGIMQHRRLLKAGKILDAPIIGPRTPSGNIKHQPAPISKEKRLILLTATIAGPILAIIIAVAIGLGGSERTPPVHPVPPDPEVAADPPVVNGSTLQRRDFPRDPIAAWRAASPRLAVTDDLLIALASEYSAIREPQLDATEDALAKGELIRARDLLDRGAVAEHPLLRSLQRRERGLAMRFAQAEQAAEKQREAETQVPETNSEPTAPASDPSDHTDPVSETPPQDPEPTPPAVPAESYLCTMAELAGDAPEASWSALEEGALELSGDVGILGRSLELTGGSYRVWCHVRAPAPPTGTLIGTLGGERFIAPPLDSFSRYTWAEITTEPINLEAGIHRLELIAAGGPWKLVRVIISNTEERPRDLGALPAPRWQARAPAPIEPVEPVPVVFKPVLIGEHTLVHAYDVAAPIPPLPGNAGPELVASERPRRTGHQLTIDVRGIDATSGGFALLLHPGRLDRALLECALTDQSGATVPLDPIVFSENEWGVHLLSVPAEGLDASNLKTLTISDPNKRLTTRFLLGKISAIAGRAPQAEDLALSERALRPLDTNELAELLQQIVYKRRMRRWWTDFDPNNKRFIIGHNIFKPNWRKAFYDELEARLGERPAPGTAEQLMLHDPWLDDRFIVPEVINDNRFHMVIVMTGGIEFPTGLTSEQALQNFWDKMLRETLASGILPVVVLGPTKTAPEQQALAEQLWQAIDARVSQRYPGVPVIDLRSVGVADFERFEPGQVADSTNLLAAAYDELRLRITMLQQYWAQK